MVQNSGFAIAIVIAHLQRDLSVGNPSLGKFPVS